MRGDVVALGGNVELGPNARVEGHAVAVLGRVESAEGATVTGRRISVTSLAGLRLGGAEERVPARLWWGIRLLSWGFWLAVTGLIAAMFPRRIIRGVWTVEHVAAASVALGLAAALTLMAALVAVFSAGAGLGLPGAVALLLVFGAGKALGLTLVGGLVGEALLWRATGRRWPISIEVFTGVVLLLTLRMVPVAGGPLWAVVSVLGLGAAIAAMAFDPLRVSAGAGLKPGK
ncbi:MAG: hypothetical protein GXP47_07185 [Acidobacteria bacterium]|nr:hypothetical protein [Acidobacteriota bacterium]